MNGCTITLRIKADCSNMIAFVIFTRMVTLPIHSISHWVNRLPIPLSHLTQISVVPFGSSPLKFWTAFFKGSLNSRATTSGRFQLDVWVAAESLISLPPFMIVSSIFFWKIQL
jgi:hypothetical protein